MIDHRQEIERAGLVAHRGQPPLQLGDPPALREYLGFADLRRGEDRLDQRRAEPRRQLAQQALRRLAVHVGGQPEAEAELGIVLEE